MPVRRGRKGKQGGKQGSGKQASVSRSPKQQALQSSDADPANDGSAVGGDALGEGIHGSNAKQPATPELILTSDKRRGVYECDYCGADISQAPRIRCSVCDDFDVCCDCFATTDPATALARLRAAHAVQQHSSAAAASAAMGSMSAAPSPSSGSAKVHDPFSHGYRVCDSTRYPIFPVRNGGIKPPTGSMLSSTNNSVSKKNSKSTSTTTTATPIGSNQVDDNDMDLDTTDGKTSRDVTAKKDSEATVSTESAAEPNLADVTMIIPAGEDIKTIWTVEEDLRLLQAIQAHGLGNWTDISEAVAGQGSQGKTPKRCMERYFDDFMGRYGHILPPYTLISEASTDAEDDGVDGETNVAAAATAATGGNSNNDESEPLNSTSSAANTTTPAKDSTDKASESIAAATAGASTGEATRSSKRRAVMLRSPSSMNNAGTVKKYKAVPTEALPEYQKVRPVPYLPVLDSGPVEVGQEVGRDQTTRAEQAYVRTIASMDNKEGVERIRKDWELNRLNKPGGPTVLPMRPDDIPTISGSELAGFMPRRGDFDVEWENNAEEAIADMEFIPGESEQDRQIKLQVLAIYNSKLDEREKRKTFVLSRKLYDYRQYQQDYQKLPTDERDLVHRMRMFERFHTPAEHRIFIDDLLKAKRLRKEIARLQMYRRMGIRTLVEAERFELDKARREFHKNAALQKEAEARKAESVATGIAVLETRAGGAIADDSESSHYWKQYRTTDRKVRKSVNRGSAPLEEGKVAVAETKAADANTTTAPAATTSVATSAAPTVATSADSESATAAAAATGSGESMDVDPPKQGPEKTSVAEDKADMDVDTKQQALGDTQTDWDWPNLPGFYQLSTREVELCQSVHLKPALYLEIKKALIYESLTKGLLDDNTKGNATGRQRSMKRLGPAFQPSLVKIDVERRGAVIDFVVRAGWISAQFGKSVRENK